MTLSFDTNFGTFRIKSASDGGDIYGLSIISEKGEALLGRFCSMNDAILAVVRQESGLPEWDELSLSKVPYRVFDITCWDFYDFSGTNTIQACS
jgi:hypothetical protein